jgi:mRNA interferase MazF
MAISSQIPDQILKDEYLISSDDQQASGLPKSSIIKLGKIVTIDQKLIRKRLGKMPGQTVLSILEKFMKVLDVR